MSASTQLPDPAHPPVSAVAYTVRRTPIGVRAISVPRRSPAAGSVHVLASSRQDDERAGRVSEQVPGDASVDQATDGGVAARADDQQVELVAELCEFLARAAVGDATLHVAQLAQARQELLLQPLDLASRGRPSVRLA